MTDETIRLTNPDAYDAGANAYHAGRSRIAPYPTDGQPVGGPWAVWAREWYHGWDAANLADETEPRCDECDIREDECEDWCGTCGCCAEHCQGFVDCPNRSTSWVSLVIPDQILR